VSTHLQGNTITYADNLAANPGRAPSTRPRTVAEAGSRHATASRVASRTADYWTVPEMSIVVTHVSDKHFCGHLTTSDTPQKLHALLRDLG